MITRQNPRGKLFVLTVDHDGFETTNRTRIATKGKSIVVDCPLEEVSSRWFKWIMLGEYIQVAFDNFTSDEREFLMTGITKEEWDLMFPKDE
jgi:hypothetical protein